MKVFKKIIWIIISILLVSIIVAVGVLVYRDITYGDVCPKLFDIPACYIILVLLIVPFLVHLLKKNKIYYFIGIGLAFCLALFATLSSVFGTFQCPVTDAGLPMCFISLLILSSLILLKILLFIVNKYVQ